MSVQFTPKPKPVARRTAMWLLASVLAITAAPGAANVPSESASSKRVPIVRAQTRCGWIENPTPANWTLVDRDGRWMIGTQGGHQAQGLARHMPDFDRADANWVVTNGSSYGYGCACMSVDVDRRTMRVTRLFSARQQPLAVCRADRRIPSH